MRKKGQGKYRGTDNVAVIRCADGKGWGREDGWNVLVGANGGAIIKMANGFEPKGKQRDVFGDGKAGEKIKGIIGRLQ